MSKRTKKPKVWPSTIDEVYRPDLRVRRNKRGGAAGLVVSKGPTKLSPDTPRWTPCDPISSCKHTVSCAIFRPKMRTKADVRREEVARRKSERETLRQRKQSERETAKMLRQSNRQRIKDWLKRYELTPDLNGEIVVYKYVVIHKRRFVAEWLIQARKSELFYYTVGQEVVAQDWNYNPVCGGGLHFEPRPSDCYYSSYNSRAIIACVVKAKEIVVVDYRKIKAPRCRVLYRCDEQGKRWRGKKVTNASA